MDVSKDHLKHLTNYIKLYVVPCFPPYYNIYQTIKQTYIDCIYQHFMDHHIDNMEEYMKSDVIDLEDTNAEVLLEFYAFLTEIKQDILNEPNNEKILDLYIRLI